MSLRRVSVRAYLFAGVLALASCAQVSADRAKALGDQMICICGCNQLLYGCTHLNCPSSTPMRAELEKYVAEGMADEAILAAFVDKYDKKVLAAPPTTGLFNISAWIMPFAALIVGAGAVLYVVRARKAAVAAEPAVSGVQPSRFDAEIEEELKKLTPED